ncbi:MAG: cell division protein ZapD [Neisseria sp.]|nr:cell division protein ZapD [Neisseria sp.]
MEHTEQRIVCEHPVIERVRSYLRLESLFTRFTCTLAKEDAEAHRLSLSTLFEIMDCASRAELKLDILQELERQKQQASNLGDDESIHQLQTCIDDLHRIQHKFGQHLRENEWLMGIKQRMAVAGSSGPIDAPSFYFWQTLPAADRRHDLEQWAQALMPTGNAVSLLLAILRGNAVGSEHIAYGGNHQQPELGRHVHLLRIETEHRLAVLPEVSANKYMMHLRFVEVDFSRTRGKQAQRDIPFHISLCSFDNTMGQAR